jgi:enoyl-CoA hydratase/carnithine racemase
VPALHRQDDVFVLDLGDTENRFHPDWITAVNAALVKVEQAEGARALVTTATGKFFSKGLDLDWLMAHGDQHLDYVASVQGLLARVLSLPVITVAALQGYTFAAGAMLSLAHDFRVTGSSVTGCGAIPTSVTATPPPSTRPRPPLTRRESTLCSTTPGNSRSSGTSITRRS